MGSSRHTTTAGASICGAMKKTRNPKEINDVEGTQLSHFPFTVILGKLEGKLPSQKRYKAPTDQLMRH